MENFKFLPKSKIDPVKSTIYASGVSPEEKKFNWVNELPKTSGVYAFKGKAELLYIGKAINIKERVKNHFQQPTHRDNLFINEVTKIGFWETNSEIEALLLEARLIKKHQPKFNVVWRDDKNYFYVAIAKTPLPKISIVHQKTDKARLVGPFIEGESLKKVLQLLRKIFPYYTADKHMPKPCLWCQIGLCPGPDPDKKQYRKNINNLVLVLEGKKQKVLRDLKKNMEKYSQSRDFEKAARARDQIFSLEKIISHAHVFILDLPNKFESTEQPQNWAKIEKLLLEILNSDKKTLSVKSAVESSGIPLKTKQFNRVNRIEGYDISNIQGKEATASMVVFINGSADKSQYRKFKIKTVEGPNDTAMIKETLSRRAHNDWPMPDLIFIDGGKGQLNAALSIITEIPICALAKRNNELFVKNKQTPLLLRDLPKEIYNLILQIRDESHRFAITYHKKLRKQRLLGK